MISRLIALTAKSLLATGVAAATHVAPSLALEMQPILPTALAIKAAAVSVESCNTNGNKVTTTVLNSEGNILVVIRNESAGPHTVEHSFNKAYTSVSFGRSFNLGSTRAIIAGTKPGKGIGEFPLPANPLKGLRYIIGGVNTYTNSKLIGSIGVAGAPNGDLDENCGQAGLNAIKLQLD